MWVLCASKGLVLGVGAVQSKQARDKVAWFGVWFGAKLSNGAKQTSEGLAWCRVLCKDKVRVPSR